MVNFSNSECVDMVMPYVVADGNVGLAHKLWIERFPNRAIPCARTFRSVVQHLRDHGTFKPQTHGDKTKKYHELKNKFWNAWNKSPTLALADL